MAAKPMPRIRAGMSGNPVVSIAGTKRPLSSDRSKSHENVRQTRLSFPGLAPDQTPSTILKHDAPSGNDETVVQTNEHCDRFLNQTLKAINVETMEKKSINHDPRINIMDTDISQSSVLTGDTDSEMQRLKELMMLQVSLISRQQDLLKLRDKEIMRLKATNQSYKSRLERMERRIALSRRQSGNKDVHLKHQEEKLLSEKQFSAKKEPTSCRVPQEETSISSVEEQSETVNKSLSQNDVLNHNDNSSTSAKTTPSAEIKPDLAMAQCTPVKQLSPGSSGCVPVPVSYIQRCQNQLYASSLTSPTTPSKTHSNLSPKLIEDLSHSKIALKVCDHCPNCVAVATEIHSLLTIAKDADDKKDNAISKRDDSSAGLDETMFYIAGLVTCKEEGNVTSGWDYNVPDKMIRTKYPYYQQVWVTDSQAYNIAEVDNIDDKNVLNGEPFSLVTERNQYILK
ncbi:unnamed protein product [Clavelina lepadiformis]|uniref:Uncharacterized protein n=1 Tax=Clavelina lepadiformis TaxID=159417 RepID=A0ABP0GTV2_CLALP